MRKSLCLGAICAIAALAPISAWAAESAQDKQVAQQLATILRESGAMQSYSIGIKYNNGTVWLSGRVTDAQQMTNALQILSSVEGIDKIVNNLAVDSETAGRGRLRQPMPGSASGVQLAAASAPLPNMMGPGGPPMQQGMPGMPAGYSMLGAEGMSEHAMAGGGAPNPAYAAGMATGTAPATYDQAHMPNWAWPSYAAYPNYGAVTYPKQYSPTAWPFIGPFYPYPQVPLGWRKVSLEWDDGWWFLDFDDRGVQ